MLAVADIRKSSEAQLWAAGCSVTHGVGVDPHERFGQLIADQLELPVSFLTCSGSSLEWASDQILRSDIRPGDTIVWGLTNIQRFAYYKDQQVDHVTVHYFQRNPGFDAVSLSELDTENRFYQAITSIDRVVNVCSKLDIKLVLAGVLLGANYLPYLTNVPGYIDLKSSMPDIVPNKPGLDVGTDGRHPGPITHKWYAEQILKELNGSR
jgi:hypothetical protein